MNTYKLLEDLPGVPAGTESYEVKEGDLILNRFRSSIDIQWDFAEEEIKKFPEWFAPVVDYKQKLEEMGWESQVVERYDDMSIRRVSMKNPETEDFIASNSYEAIYNMITDKPAEETKAEMIGRASDRAANRPVTYEDMITHCRMTCEGIRVDPYGWEIYDSKDELKYTGTIEKKLKSLLRS